MRVTYRRLPLSRVDIVTIDAIWSLGRAEPLDAGVDTAVARCKLGLSLVPDSNLGEQQSDG